MIPNEQAAWRRALGEASCLPPEDAERLVVEAEVARRGGLVEKEWFALLAEAERWRIELRRVEPPADLEARLLQLADAPHPRLWRAPRPWLRPALAAVALLLVALAIALASRERTQPTAPAPDPLQTLALLAMNDHRGTHGLEVTTAEPDTLTRELAGRIPFPIRVPELGSGATLLGGRRCTLGSHPVCFSAWQADGARLTLIQLRSHDFGLPSDLTPVIVTPVGAAAAGGPLDVLIWSAGEFAYALVADDPAVLRRVGPTVR